MVGQEAIGGNSEAKGFASLLNNPKEALVVPVAPEVQLAPSPSINDVIPAPGYSIRKGRDITPYPRKPQKSQE